MWIVHRSPSSSADREIGQYWPYVFMASSSRHGSVLELDGGRLRWSWLSSSTARTHATDIEQRTDAHHQERHPDQDRRARRRRLARRSTSATRPATGRWPPSTSHSAPAPTSRPCSKGLDDDACHAPHWGFMMSGRGRAHLHRRHGGDLRRRRPLLLAARTQRAGRGRRRGDPVQPAGRARRGHGPHDRGDGRLTRRWSASAHPGGRQTLHRGQVRRGAEIGATACRARSTCRRSRAGFPRSRRCEATSHGWMALACRPAMPTGARGSVRRVRGYRYPPSRLS